MLQPVRSRRARRIKPWIPLLGAAVVLTQGLRFVPDPGGETGVAGSTAASGTAALNLLLPGAQAAAVSTDGAAPGQKWTCPMHPHYVALEFGQCPICGMDLVKLDSDTDAGPTGASAPRSAVTVPAETIQSMGIRVARSELTRFGRELRSFGTVQENERLQLEVTSRVEGWVENLAVRAVGDKVERGARLFELYSPELIVSQNDYLRTGRSQALREQARAHLQALGMQGPALRDLEASGKPLQRVPFYASSSGTVSELLIREGSYVARGTLLARIQDYSSVWLMVSVPEKDLGLVDPDTVASVSFPNLPGHEVTARIDYVYPTVDFRTRTGQVRLVIDNPDGQIRPGSYADVTLRVASQERLAVPAEAVLKSGSGTHVVVSLGKGRFEPRRVQLGLTSGRWVEVREGVEAGEDVVVSGQFLLDSESALRESFRKLERLQMPLAMLQLSGEEFAMVDHLVDAALYLHEALIDGYEVDAQFLEPALSIRDLMWAAFEHTQLAFVLEDARAAVALAQTARTESETREALAKLVDALRPWVLEGAPQHYRELNVTMFRDQDSGRQWLQLEGRPFNPFGRGDAELIAPAAAPPGVSDTPPASGAMS